MARKQAQLRTSRGLESRHDLPAIHSELDDLEGDAAFDRLALLSHPDFAEAALADLFEQLIAADNRGGSFLDWSFVAPRPATV